MTKNEKAITDFINDLYTTKTARFCAERRLRHKQLLSHITISVLSAYIICVGAIPFYGLPIEISPSYLQFTTFALSVFLLVISLLEIGANRISLANALHENGIQINDLYKQALLCSEVTEINKIRVAYNKALSACLYNHEKIDYYEVKKDNNNYGFWTRFVYTFRYIIQWSLYYGLYWLLMLSPPIILVITLCL
jgi:hypothetical protein